MYPHISVLNTWGLFPLRASNYSVMSKVQKYFLILAVYSRESPNLRWSLPGRNFLSIFSINVMYNEYLNVNSPKSQPTWHFILPAKVLII